ncbi:MAG: hypothetical protein AAGA56_08995 [Myxococcota bacterium]
MLKLRKALIWAVLPAALTADPPPAAALSCDWWYSEELSLELESVEVDGQPTAISNEYDSFDVYVSGVQNEDSFWVHYFRRDALFIWRETYR